MRKRSTVVLAGFAFSFSVAAAVVSVPPRREEIQAALEAAEDGDTIIVERGICFLSKPLIMPAKEISFQSRLGREYSALIVNMSEAILFRRGVFKTSISGFNMRLHPDSTSGRGIWMEGNCKGSQITIKDCSFRGLDNMFGGALHIEGNKFETGSLTVSSGPGHLLYFGRNLALYTSGLSFETRFNTPILFEENAIRNSPRVRIRAHKAIVRDNDFRYAGGMEIHWSPPEPLVGYVVFKDNVLYGSGGLWIENISADVEGNRFERSPGSLFLTCEFDGWARTCGRLRVRNNVVLGNGIETGERFSVSDPVILVDVGGISTACEFEFTGNVIAGNTAEYTLYTRFQMLDHSPLVTFERNTIAYNCPPKRREEERAWQKGTLTTVGPWDDFFLVSNSVVWDCGWSDYLYCFKESRYSCFDSKRKALGESDISSDPLFVDPADGDFRLLPASPCIDAGDPDAPLDPDGTRADIGAIPFDHRNPLFLRGDVTGEGRVNLADMVSAIEALFGLREPMCEKAADFDDDNRLSLEDALGIARYLLSDGPEPAEPFPEPGEDPTADGLSCGRRGEPATTGGRGQ